MRTALGNVRILAGEATFATARRRSVASAMIFSCTMSAPRWSPAFHRRRSISKVALGAETSAPYVTCRIPGLDSTFRVIVRLVVRTEP